MVWKTLLIKIRILRNRCGQFAPKPGSTIASGCSTVSLDRLSRPNDQNFRYYTLKRATTLRSLGLWPDCKWRKSTHWFNIADNDHWRLRTRETHLSDSKLPALARNPPNLPVEMRLVQRTYGQSDLQGQRSINRQPKQILRVSACSHGKKQPKHTWQIWKAGWLQVEKCRSVEEAANYSRQTFRVEMFVFTYKSTLRVRKSESKSLYCLSGNVCSEFTLTYPASGCLGY